MPEYVYVLSNPAMPDIVKVGRTNDVRRRMAISSSRTEVPLPFVLELAIEIDDAAKLALNTTNEVAPCPYWMFEGRRLQEITDERYG